MAETTITLARTAAAVIDQAYPSNHSNFADGTVITNANGSQRILLAQFEQLASNYKYAKIVKATLGGGADAIGNSGTLAVSQAGASDLSAVTWETQPIIDSAFIGYVYVSRFSPQRNSFPYPFPKGKTPTSAESIVPIAYTAKEASEAARQLLRAETLAIWSWKTAETEETSCAYREGTSSITTPGSYTPFNLYVIIDPAVTIQNTVQAKDDTPRTGYMSPYEAHTFAWDFVSSDDTYTCAGDWDQSAATFYYRNGTSGAWTSVSFSTAKSYTLSASAFSVGTFQWYVTATDTDGRTTVSPVYTLSTADSAAVAAPLEPNGSVEDGSAPILFTWSASNDTGTTPTGADLQYSTNGSSWTTFAQPRTSATQYSAPASTFPAGNIQWRVRSLNADGVAGAWSDPLSFVCFAAPAAPIISTNGKPMLTVTWQSENQQAYKVIVDGRTYGPYFGTGKSFTVPDFLSDGTHTVAVSVQNEYSLWSLIDPETDAGIISVTVTNVPGEPVTLTGLFDRDAELSWSTTDATSDFLIYRDGVQIGHASGRSFTDRVVLGYHSWRVINRLPGGYYTASNVVSGTLMTGRLAIAPLSGAAWLELTKSENSARSVVWNESQRVVLRQFAGQIYPQAEAAPYKTMSAGFDVAWTHAEAEQAAIFAALIGQPVIFKTPCEGAMVGILTAWQRNNMHFYRSYSATVQRIHWRDFVDADD